MCVHVITREIGVHIELAVLGRQRGHLGWPLRKSERLSLRTSPRKSVHAQGCGEGLDRLT